MDKKEELRLRDEIDYWSKHQELDKFNYTQNTTMFFSVIIILLTILLWLQQEIDSDIILSISKLVFILIIVGLYFIVDYRNKNTDNHFTLRDVMIEEKYCKLNNLEKGKFKEKLNEEFNELRKNFINNLKLKLWLKFLIIFLFISLFFIGYLFFRLSTCS